MEAYLQRIRHALFEKALKQSGGNRSEAARLLGITPQAVHKFLKHGEIKEETVSR
jgi:DNA-binding NtrC family response regulator